MKDVTYVQLGSSNHSLSEREKNDFYATDPIAINSLFKVEDFSNDIWECAAGQGHLSNRMKELGKNVYSTDLINRAGYEIKDFLTSTEKWKGDIITNPPYKYGLEFIYKAIELSNNKVAFFLRTLFVESLKRRILYDEYPPKNIWVFSRRISTIKGGGNIFPGSAVSYSWFVWEKGWTGKTTLGWI